MHGNKCLTIFVSMKKERIFKTTCSKCEGALEEDRISKHAYCKPCKAEYSRKNRKKHSEMDIIEKEKALVRATLKMFIKRKGIVKPPCEICGEEKVEAHHHDYSKPNEVNWLCRKHHKKHHKDGLVLGPPTAYEFKSGIKKSCSKCGEALVEKRIGKYRYCNKCQADYMKLKRYKENKWQYCPDCKEKLEVDRVGLGRCKSCQNKHRRTLINKN
jgi:hypothetical protein